MLKEIVQSLKTYKTGKGAPKALKLFANDSMLAPTNEIEYTDNSSSNKTNVCKFSNYLPALLAHASKNTQDPEGGKCDGCKKGNGKFAGCKVAFDNDDNILFNGACTNCIFGSSSSACSTMESKRS